jgi:DAACS family dicarboxylate/amino acid:cation (Na+ or H+) symporter
MHPLDPGSQGKSSSPHGTQATRILIGLIVGGLGGLVLFFVSRSWPDTAPTLRWVAREVLDPFGQLFLRLLTLVVVPLVFASLAYGVAQLGDLRRLGPLAARTLALFLLNMAIGVGLGLIMMNLLQPGLAIDDATRDRLLAAVQSDSGAKPDPIVLGDSLSLRRLVDLFLPRNLLQAVVGFQLLPLIVFGLLVGAAITGLARERKTAWEAGLQSVVDLMARIVGWAMKLAPWAVAALVAAVVSQAGLELLGALLVFVLGVLLVMGIHLVGTLPLLLKLLSRRSPLAFMRAVWVVLATAFSTSSSNATLPTSLQVSRDVLGVSPATAGFVLPLGATLNMSGTALYEGCVVLFVAQVYGFELSLGQQMQLLLLAVLSAIAVAGVPGASLPVLIGLLANFGLPPEGIGLILGFDRLLDMARTTVNVAADLVTACIIDDQLPPTSREDIEAGRRVG